MKNLTLLFLTFNVLFSSCKEREKNTIENDSKMEELVIIGDTIKQLGKNIMTIFQDKKNNYWFGSWEDGLYKYDGKKMLHFNTKNGLPSNRVEEIKEDKQGNLYFNTSKGILKYNGANFSLLHETFGEIDKWSLTPNDIWFKNFTNDQFVFRYDGVILHKLKLPKIKLGEEWIQKNPTSPNPYSIYCSYKDSRGNVWFGTAAVGAFRYDGTKFDWITESDVNELHYGPSNGVRSITEDKDGYFWFNTEYKYNIYNIIATTKNAKDSNLFYERIKSIGSLDGKNTSALKEYLSITKDNNNNLWLVTYLEGVWKYDGTKVTHYPVQVNSKTITLFSIYKDNNGDLWLGTHENGAFKFNGEKFEKFLVL